MKNIYRWTLAITLISNAYIYCLSIDRVILASDENPQYFQFWPDVASWWKKIIGIEKVTLVFVGNQNQTVDMQGFVIKMKKISKVSAGLQAQVARLLMPIKFQNECCLIGDIDMIPLSREFLVDFIKHVPDDHIVIYHVYPPKSSYAIGRYPMCYIAAKGKVFGEIFNVYNERDIESKIKEWSDLNLGFETDEIVLRRSLEKWKDFSTRCTIVDIHPFYSRRLGRDLSFDSQKLKNNYYIDAHCPRPYLKHYEKINQLITERLSSMESNIE